MQDKNITVGFAEKYTRDDLVDFLNYVFGFNGRDTDFVNLLPKIYKEKYEPCKKNYIIEEDGRIRAAVGSFKRDMDVLGERLSVCGIGNVAVHPRSRSSGYMKILMKKAIDDMISGGADIADLGGLRHRYGYFSYELAGMKYSFEIDGTCIRHCFGGSEFKKLDFIGVEEDSVFKDEIVSLHAKKPLHFIRNAEDFVDIAHSWGRELFAIVDGDRFVGYFIGELDELTLVSESDLYCVVRNYIERFGNVTLFVPTHEMERASALFKICAECKTVGDQNYSILNYRRTLSAFMKLKASVCPMIDGSLVVEINGVAGKENLKIHVLDGKTQVVPTDDLPDVVLEHKQAVSFFFSAFSPEREIDPLARAWFPLPLCIPTADHV
ncbi:MAG: GNAT family N-acetyltransferase [Clostridia bacterium]|nr:GNAT family N-acetyltransferase [Clostridia bacterium]